MTREQFHHWSRALSRYLFIPAIFVVIWGQLQHGEVTFDPSMSDKLLHFTAYFGLAGMATVALDGSRRTFSAMLLLALMGGTMEMIQGMTGRDAELLDEVANIVGILVGWGLGHIFTGLSGARASLAARHSGG